MADKRGVSRTAEPEQHSTVVIEPGDHSMTQTPHLPPGKSPEPIPYTIGMRDDGRGSDRRPKRFSTVEFGMLLVAVLAALKLLLDAVMSALDMILAAQFFWVLIIATSGPLIIQGHDCQTLDCLRTRRAWRVPRSRARR
jgi:hypothetical protein